MGKKDNQSEENGLLKMKRMPSFDEMCARWQSLEQQAQKQGTSVMEILDNIEIAAAHTHSDDNG